MKKAWIVALLGIGAILVFYMLFMTTYYVTSHPTRFCNRCHFLEPYVESWEASPHNDVNCLHCHEMRGFVGKIEAKSRGLNYLYQTITRQYSLPIQAKIFEQNCFSCHVGDYRNFPQATPLGNSSVNHYDLVREDRSCLECHRDAGHGLNLLVTPDLSGAR
ncbi:MAG: NapC/NirT family cytochrome c [Bacillota bacterium]|nr:NapC/NirT family cytochrome c [Bacillota bacterium]MDW7683645.1 NapC/NirT family cytochrome c [Bacillota bacterium]